MLKVNSYREMLDFEEWVEVEVSWWDKNHL